MMQRLQRFMWGRNGIDQMNVGLLGCGIVCSLLAMLFTRSFYVLADVFYFVVLWRALSKNLEKRQRENQVFVRKYNAAKQWFQQKKQRFAQRETYKYFKCPSCRQQLRAPRGRGTIEVTCQSCRHVFRTKT